MHTDEGVDVSMSAFEFAIEVEERTLETQGEGRADRALAGPPGPMSRIMLAGMSRDR